MAFDTKFFLKSLSPKMMAKAMRSFDRATTVVVISCWGAAFVMLAAAIYTLTMSVSAHRAADSAMAAEPILPKIAHKPMDMKTAQTVFDRMQHRFPEVNFSVKGAELQVTSSNGSHFHEWLMALSYVDTITPEFHWSIDEFCVGQCPNNQLMYTVLKGDHISFEAPSGDDKN